MWGRPHDDDPAARRGGLITAVIDHEVAFDGALDALARRCAGGARGTTIIRI
jgi:hypothetical protein